LVLGWLDIDALVHYDLTHNLLSNEVTDLNLVQAGLTVLLEIDVEGEMGVDVSHLVLVALGDADDEVVDQSSNCAESGDIFPCAVVEFDVDDARGGVGEGDC